MSNIRKCDPWDMSPSNLEVCPLARACNRGELGPMIGRAAITRNTCSDGSDRLCGRATAYYEAAMCALYLDTLDEVAPVTHTITITSTPEGEAPEEIRNSIVGTSVYARQSLLPDALKEGFMAVHATDFLLALHADAKFDAASWYANNHPHKEENMPIWVFEKKDLTIYDDSHVPRINSAAKYGSFAWTLTGLYAIWSGYLIQPEAFSPSSEKGKQYYDAMREIADEEFGGNIAAAINAHMSETFAYGSFSYLFDHGKGRVTTTDDKGMKMVRDNGRLIYDRDAGIDFRDNPQDAPVPEEHMIDRFRRKLEQRQLSGVKSYPIKVADSNIVGVLVTDDTSTSTFYS